MNPNTTKTHISLGIIFLKLGVLDSGARRSTLQIEPPPVRVDEVVMTCVIIQKDRVFYDNYGAPNPIDRTALRNKKGRQREKRREGSEN